MDFKVISDKSEICHNTVNVDMVIKDSNDNYILLKTCCPFKILSMNFQERNFLISDNIGHLKRHKLVNEEEINVAKELMNKYDKLMNKIKEKKLNLKNLFNEIRRPKHKITNLENDFAVELTLEPNL